MLISIAIVYCHILPRFVMIQEMMTTTAGLPFSGPRRPCSFVTSWRTWEQKLHMASPRHDAYLISNVWITKEHRNTGSLVLLVGGFNPSEKMFVSWDDSSQWIDKNMFRTTIQIMCSRSFPIWLVPSCKWRGSNWPDALASRALEQHNSHHWTTRGVFHCSSRYLQIMS